MDSRSRIVLVGSGGHARSVADAICASGGYKIIGTVAPSGELGYLGIPSLGGDEMLPELYKGGTRFAHIAIGYLGGRDRRPSLKKMLERLGFKLPAIVDPSSSLACDCEVGEGSFIGKRSVVNACSRVGRMVILNTGSIVEHDCVVGDYSHISVNAVLCGGVTIGSSVFIGASAVVLQGITVGDGAIIGAGATVLHDVPPGEKVIGVY